MALAPQEYTGSTSDIIRHVEAIIDYRIATVSEPSIRIDCGWLGMPRDLWEVHLKPKYLAVGWKSAEWVTDEDAGDYVELKA